MTLVQAIRYCTQLTKAHSSTFYLGSRVFSPKKRKAVSVVYAVCRSGDDAVDEASTPILGCHRLTHWWAQVERAYDHQPRHNEPLEMGLSWVIHNYDVPKEAFYELYLGLQSDLDPQPFETLNDLMLYCRRVAGVVGYMIAAIAGYRGGEETRLHALALGQAMQLTNILRDVGEDLRLGRCYLPQTFLKKHKVDPEALHNGLVTENYINLLEDLAEFTTKLYRLGWQGIPKLNGLSSVAVAVAALNYEAILHKLRHNNYDNLNCRAHLKTFERIVLIPRAVYCAYGG